jgi:nitrite reductase (NADH) small subunit
VTSVEDRFRQARVGAPVSELPARWVDVLPVAELAVEVGVPALVGDRAVAVFRTHTDELYAVSNYDPASGASVMARGIVGSRGDVPVVVSPMYKHVFDLRTGRCLDDESKALTPYEIRVEAGMVQVRPANADGTGHP